MPAETNWFKGNLHMHSFWSDGYGFPEMITDWFKQQGYHFIAFTEHDRLQTGEMWIVCDAARDKVSVLVPAELLPSYLERFGSVWVETRTCEAGQKVRLKTMEEYRHLFEEPDRFLLMTGEEVTTEWGSGKFKDAHWFNVFNLPQAVYPQQTSSPSTEAMRMTLDAAEATSQSTGRPALISLNHPNWQWNATAENIAAVPNLSFMEIHTALSSCRNDGDDLHASMEQIWDIVLTQRIAEMNGGLIYGLATDDSHAYDARHHPLGRGVLPGRAWIMVCAEHLTTEHLIGAMQRGEFYATTGVLLEEVKHTDRTIEIAIQAEPGVRYSTRFIGTRTGYDPTSFPVTDADGRTVRTTRRYSADIGSVLGEADGTEPSYQFLGDELYVRAVITSDTPHPNPHTPNDLKKAWSQPVRREGHRSR